MEASQRAFRFAVRVRPGAPREAVGGGWDGGHGAALQVSVTARAVDGKANDAVRKAIAKAFRTRQQHVRIMSGERGRNKVIELDPAPAGAAARLTALLGQGSARED